MAARKDQEFQELDEIFKSLAIRNNRFRPIYKNRDFSFSPPNILEMIWSACSTISQTFLDVPIKIQPCGSLAEDFDYRQDFEDLGDFDLMISPTSENIMIYDEMIEYLPENPVHVRIKGADHPLLQSCLVEGTEYVATSALKSFHPAIYGSLGEVLSSMVGLDTWMAQDRVFSHPNLPFISFHLVKNSVTSPAITVAMAVSTAKASAFFETDVKESTEGDNQFERYAEGQPVIDVKNVWNASNKDDENIPGERRNKQSSVERFFGDLKRTLRTVTAEEIIISYDLVPALQSAGWPTVAQEWIERKRKWPSPSMVNKVIQEGFHLVVKPPKNGDCPDCDFRISFSNAELLLSKEMNDIQRECYICLKQYHRTYLCSLSDGLTTFHLKNIYLQTIEETGAEMWRESNRAECMMKLLENLLEALRKKHLPNFFVKKYNLFSTDYIEDPEILESLAGTVKEIMENPVKFSKDMLQNQDSEDPWPWQAKTEESVPSRKFASFGNLGTEGHEHVEIEETLATQREHDMLLSANQSENNLPTSPDDMKELFCATMKELIDMASNDDDDALEALDPLEKSLVEEFRDIQRKWPLERFYETINRNCGSHWLFMLIAFRPEPNMRRRALVAIQAVVKVTKYMMRQVDSGAPGGALGAVLRMLDPTAEDKVDWSLVMPPSFEQAPYQLFKISTELVKSLLPKPAQLQEFDMDDIALD